MGFLPQEEGWPPSSITKHQAVLGQSPEPISPSLKTPSRTLEDSLGPASSGPFILGLPAIRLNNLAQKALIRASILPIFTEPSRLSSDLTSGTVLQYHTVLPHGPLTSEFSTLAGSHFLCPLSLSTGPGTTGTHAWEKHGLRPASPPLPRKGSQPWL